MKENKAAFTPIVIKKHRDLSANRREISRRFNANPALARMVIVNPILAFNDVGVELYPEVQRHIINAMRFPPKLRERIDILTKELRQELDAIGVAHELPLTSAQRAELLFSKLRIKPNLKHSQSPQKLEWKDVRAYARYHPLASKLADYERARQGGLVFHRQGTYDAIKNETRRFPWIRAVRFNISD